MRRLALFGVLFCAGCSSLIQEFDGVKGYEILSPEEPVGLRYVDDKFVSWGEIASRADQACKVVSGEKYAFLLRQQGRIKKPVMMRRMEVSAADGGVWSSQSAETPSAKSEAMYALYTFKKVEGDCAIRE